MGFQHLPESSPSHLEFMPSLTPCPGQVSQAETFSLWLKQVADSRGPLTPPGPFYLAGAAEVGAF